MSQLVDDIEQFLADDMVILRELLLEVRGLSPVSMTPELALDGDGEAESYDFAG